MNYDLCLKLKVLGLPQSHKTGALHYIIPDVIIKTEDMVNTISDEEETMADWSSFVFIPQIQNILDFLGSDFSEVRFMPGANDASRTYCAYSIHGFSPTEPPIMGFGSTVREAIANLAIIVKAGDVKESA